MTSTACFCAMIATAVPLVAFAQQGERLDSSRVTWTTVTYLSGSSVYLGAGTRAGLIQGSRVDIVRRDTVIAELIVEFVSSTSASSRIARSVELPVVGDSARFVAVIPKPTVVSSSPATVNAGVKRRSGALHGRVGVREFVTAPSAGGSVRQPAIDARVDGQSLGGSPIGLVAEVRAHRTRRAAPASSTRDGSTRVYQAALHIDGAAGPGRITLGRQFATALSAVGLFDGLSADYTWAHTGAGLFAGTQPDARDFGLSSAIREYGAWFQLHNAPTDRAIWSLTTGAIGSYAASEVNREFLYVQGQVVHRAFSFFAAQELDYNRGWRAEAESTTTTPTSTFLTARVSLGPALAISGGYDNRRNVRIYRDFTSPEVEFDDSFRQGIWGGAQLSLAGHFQAGFDSRSSRGGSSGTSTSWTTSAGFVRLTPLGIGVRARATRYASTLLDGSLRSGSIEMQPGGRIRVEVNAGIREDHHAVEGMVPTSLRWLGADLETGLGRSLFFTLSTYRETGPDGRLLQYFGSLSYRF